KPTDDQWLNSVASLIPFATIEEDLEEYYNYPGESYFTYESEEDNSDTEMTIFNANSNSRILERGTTYLLFSESEIESQSRSTVFTPFKPPFKKAKISSSKHQQSNLQQNQFYNTQENQLYNIQENRSYNIQENRSDNAQENHSYYAQENQSYNAQEN
ncbi:13259_t:CDS:2, partial [Racocetra persica]